MHSHSTSAHAALSPWEGRNALDAAVLAYNNISALRQQFKPTHRVHGIIIGKDWAPNSKFSVLSLRLPSLTRFSRFSHPRRFQDGVCIFMLFLSGTYFRYSIIRYYQMVRSSSDTSRSRNSRQESYSVFRVSSLSISWISLVN